jgi:tetratricopeptide (TPR) repeat protein
MFQTGNIKSPAPAKKEPQSSATMVFGQSPVAPAARPAIGKPSEAAASTMMFAASPGAAAKVAAKAAPPPQAEPEAESEAPTESSPESEETPADGNPPAGMAAGRHDTVPEGEGDLEGAEPSESGVEAEGAEQDLAPEKPGAFDKAPPKGLLIGVGAGIAVLLLVGVGLFAWKKLSKHPPPPQAIEALTAATAAADKDTLASIAEADSKVKEALDLAGPRSYFPQATATLAIIEIQWADALNDQAALWTGRGNKAAEAGDDAKKAEADTKAAELTNQAKAHLKSAFDTVVPALKQDDKSPELELALADYYRAQRSNSNMNRELKKAQKREAEPNRIALVQAMAAAQEDDGAEKALPKLKDALAANPRNARIHFRMAMAYLMMKDDANALKELKETLKLSPQHERAKMAMELLPASAPAEQK